MISTTDINRAASLVCTDQQRYILHSHYNEDKSLRQIARDLDLHHSTVIAEHFKALNLIHDHLRGDAA